MKQSIIHLLLIARYYPFGTFFVLASIGSFIFSRFAPPQLADEAIIGCTILSITSILLLMVNTSLRGVLFKTGELNKSTVLEIINTLIEIETRIPIQNVYSKRPKRPMLFHILWSRGRVHKRLMKWMGIDPSNVKIVDKHSTSNGIAGTADTRNETITISSRIKENHPDAYLTTLVHEIAHLLEARIGLHAYIAAFEEEFTDTLCVFLGLGDVMLNGCMSIHHESTWYGTYTEHRHEKQQVGYLSPLQLAIAEVLVTEMSNNYGKVRKHYNSHSYSLLTKTRIWLQSRGVCLQNRELIPAIEYLNQIRSQVEGLRK